MKTTRLSLLSALLLLLPLLLLASCLDYREELWINGNGSGKIHATIAINSELGFPVSDETQSDPLEAQLKDLFATTEGAEVENYQTYVEGKKRIYDFTVSFRDLKHLKPAMISGQGNIGAVFGEFEITKIPDGSLSVKRVITLSNFDDPNAPQNPGDSTEERLGGAIGQALGGLVADTMFANYHLDYVTHFPSKIVSANTPNIDRGTNTVSWRFPLSQASKGPVTMKAEIKRPGGWIIWTFVGLVVIVTLAILIPAFRKKA